MLGVFLALDMALFYIFWEFTLIPMYFIIGLWGGERRLYAAIKFVLYTLTGSLAMSAFVAFRVLQQMYFRSGTPRLAQHYWVNVVAAFCALCVVVLSFIPAELFQMAAQALLSL